MTRRNYTYMATSSKRQTKTHWLWRGNRQSKQCIIPVFTKHADSALLRRHHQGRAARLVDGIDWCIMGEEQLDTVHVTREGRCMEGGSAGGREREKVEEG